MKNKVRADLWLVELGLAASRTQAQALVAQGLVSLQLPNSRLLPITKASHLVQIGEKLIVQPNPDQQYVSRAGLKLAGALDANEISVAGLRILDLGLSTGGFADCCLQRGASLVLGLDVGHNQLHLSLRDHPRLKSVEGFNVRHLQPGDLERFGESELFDLLLCDVSFISLRLVLPAAIQYLKEAGQLLLLVKPQFEAGREAIGKGGIVKDPKFHLAVQNAMLAFVQELGFQPISYLASQLEGADGNREFFLYAKR